jgi:hypothetical protein
MTTRASTVVPLLMLPHCAWHFPATTGARSQAQDILDRQWGVIAEPRCLVHRCCTRSSRSSRSSRNACSGDLIVNATNHPKKGTVVTGAAGPAARAAIEPEGI